MKGTMFAIGVIVLALIAVAVIAFVLHDIEHSEESPDRTDRPPRVEAGIQVRRHPYPVYRDAPERHAEHTCCNCGHDRSWHSHGACELPMGLRHPALCGCDRYQSVQEDIAFARRAYFAAINRGRHAGFTVSDQGVIERGR